MASPKSIVRTEPFRFLDLLRELRDYVYSYTFNSGRIIPNNPSEASIWNFCTASGLRFVCRQVHDELIDACVRFTKACLQEDLSLYFNQFKVFAPFLKYLDWETRTTMPTFWTEVTNESDIRVQLDQFLRCLQDADCMLYVELSMQVTYDILGPDNVEQHLERHVSTWYSDNDDWFLRQQLVCRIPC